MRGTVQGVKAVDGVNNMDLTLNLWQGHIQKGITPSAGVSKDDLFSLRIEIALVQEQLWHLQKKVDRIEERA